jgi:hypothetical protein
VPLQTGHRPDRGNHDSQAIRRDLPHRLPAEYSVTSLAPTIENFRRGHRSHSPAEGRDPDGASHGRAGLLDRGVRRRQPGG